MRDCLARVKDFATQPKTYIHFLISVCCLVFNALNLVITSTKEITNSLYSTYKENTARQRNKLSLTMFAI